MLPQVWLKSPSPAWSKHYYLLVPNDAGNTIKRLFQLVLTPLNITIQQYNRNRFHRRVPVESKTDGSERVPDGGGAWQ